MSGPKASALSGPANLPEIAFRLAANHARYRATCIQGKLPDAIKRIKPGLRLGNHWQDARVQTAGHLGKSNRSARKAGRSFASSYVPRTLPKWRGSA
jgi:hypothetical protein